MSNAGKRVVRKFNPGMLQSDAELIRQFVVRESELTILLHLLRNNIDSPSCQHALLVGPRGRGKTMLLARVAAEIREASGLSDALVPVRLMEESYEVFSLGDFWLEVLFHLAMELERPHPDLFLELKDTHADLATRVQGPEWEEQTFAAVLETADLLGKKLVVMVENMHDICRQADKHFGWKLRKMMQMEPSIVLIGSATSRFAAMDDAREPFFDIFRTLNLEPLDAAECAKLWESITGESVGKRQIRPLQILTGGSPRLVAVVADFATRRSLARLMDDLADLVDEHTDYFRSQLGALTGNKRRVYVALVDLWRPSSAGEIARRARLGIRTVSTVLGRLVDDGVVEIVNNGTPGRYAVLERLMCIYYKLRRQREGGTVVRQVIDFMRAYYGEERATEWLGEVAMDRPETFDASVYDAIFAQWGVEGRPEVRRAAVAGVLATIGAHAVRNPSSDILAVCDSVEHVLRDLGSEEDGPPKLMLAGTRAITLFGIGHERAAMNEVSVMYEAYRPSGKVMVAALLENTLSVVPITAVKATEKAQRRIVDVLSSDEVKAWSLLPLIVALRIRLGDAVRAPAEVMEVAHDLVREIQKRERTYRAWEAERF